MHKDGADILDDGLKGPRIKGVFSSREADGGGEKTYWFAKEIDTDAISLDMLDENMLPTGRRRIRDKDDFLIEYALEPELGYRLLTQRVLRGDMYRKQDKNLEAKIEYRQALRIDEENIRANFGLGLCYLALNQLDKAGYVFTNIVAMDESFGEEHKHLFNEFGIALRKKGLFDEAVRYYSRAVELCPTDENLYLNMARADFDKGDREGAFLYLKRTLELNPDQSEARAFLAWLRKNDIKPQDPDMAAYFRWASSRSLLTAKDDKDEEDSDD